MSEVNMKRSTARRRTGLTVSLAVAAVTASTLAVAGPFCNNGYRGAGPVMQPYSPMGPGPQAYYGAPTRGMSTMAAPGGYRMPAYAGNQGRYASQMMTAPARAASPQTAVNADKDESTGNNITVRIDGMRFEPAIITVEPGTTVTWVQNSSMPHTVNGSTASMRSKTLYSGQTFSHTFDEAGSYDYVCDFHPAMKGSVVVKDGGTRT